MPLADALGPIGAIIDTGIGFYQAHKERKRQKEFAQKGIQWRAADAAAAGIHPLAAMGAQLFNPTPVTVGTDFASVGQNISNNVRNQKGARTAIETLSLEKVGLENKLLAAQIRQLDQQTASANRQFENPRIPDLGEAKGYGDTVNLVPSNEVKQRIEDNLLYETQHLIRNQVVPNFRTGGAVDARGRRGWVNPLTGTFHPFKKGSFTERMFRPIRDFMK